MSAQDEYYIKLLQDASDTMRGYWGAGIGRQCLRATVEMVATGVFTITCEFWNHFNETLSGSRILHFQPTKNIENIRLARRAVSECFGLIYKEADFIRRNKDAVATADARLQHAIDDAIEAFNATHEDELHTIHFERYYHVGWYALCFEYTINNLPGAFTCESFYLEQDAEKLTRYATDAYQLIINREKALM